MCVLKTNIKRFGSVQTLHQHMIFKKVGLCTEKCEQTRKSRQLRKVGTDATK